MGTVRLERLKMQYSSPEATDAEIEELLAENRDVYKAVKLKCTLEGVGFFARGRIRRALKRINNEFEPTVEYKEDKHWFSNSFDIKIEGQLHDVNFVWIFLQKLIKNILI